MRRLSILKQRPRLVDNDAVGLMRIVPRDRDRDAQSLRQARSTSTSISRSRLSRRRSPSSVSKRNPSKSPNRSNINPATLPV